MSDHISDIEFVNPQAGPSVYPKHNIGVCNVADILNDLAARLRAVEAENADLRAEVEVMKLDPTPCDYGKTMEKAPWLDK